MKVAIIGKSRQEWERSGPYLFAVLGECIDLEHGAKVYNMPPFLTMDQYDQVDRNALMNIAPNLTWVNVEHEKARINIFDGMSTRLPIGPDDGSAVHDPQVMGMIQKKTLMRMIRTTSTISFPGANFSWVSMRNHTAHGTNGRPGTCKIKK